MRQAKKLFNLFTLLRPYSWIKNFFIFIPLFFAREFFVDDKLFKTILAFVIFCLAASSVYILNDILDREQDKKHDTKKHRPLASGLVSLKSAIIMLIGLFIADILLIHLFLPQIFWLVISYFILNVLYSVYLKHVPILDILLISSFYFIRIMIGSVVGDVFISNWLLICIILISLFLIVGKRLAEFGQNEKRTVLLQYSKGYLVKTLIALSVLLAVFYSLYCVLVLKSNLGIFSIILVLLGLLRYLFLVFTTHKTEYPERLLITDKIIFSASLVWIVVIYFIIYVRV